ncbi:hypothetical protein NQF87_03995 [Bombella sp. TMW 2.2559]|uniref:DUF4169 family protein n=1 Tax=Bombella dulcis TaxID=2967339 RepID=A0ABT3WGX7_9PROT|nr:hypothetical protein [Bombella dulcis]MCX5616136.1 hypothetical protein [Bombella dulcis]
MKPDQNGTPGGTAMTARQERQMREAQALRANLLRRKQQQRNRPAQSDRSMSSTRQEER